MYVCFRIYVKNKYKLYGFVFLVLFVFAIVLFGNVFRTVVSVTELTGNVVLFSEDSDVQDYASICDQRDIAKNYDDCKYYRKTGEKRDSIEQISDSALDSFCNELIRVYSNC